MLAGLAARLARQPRSLAARVTAVRGDLRDLALGQRFPLILAGFNVLEHLYTRVELDACLARVRAHLAPDGAFAFDVQLPDPGWLARDPTRRWSRTRFTHPVTGAPTWYTTNHDYDPASQVMTFQPMAPVSAPKITRSSTMAVWMMPEPTVCATCRPKNKS